MDLPMTAADALFLWAETPTRLHVGALAALTARQRDRARYPRKVFLPRWPVSRRRGGADARTGRSPARQWSWRTETEVT